MPDLATINRILEGDQSGLESLFESYYARLCKYGAKLTDEPQVSEEIVQDLFVNIWERKDSLNIQQSVESYLFRAVKNRCINHLQSKYRSYLHEEISDSSEPNRNTNPISESLDHAELLALLIRAEEKLPKKTAIVFSLSRHSDLSHQEIADKLGISTKTVEYHISNALKIIREQMAAEGYTYPCVSTLALLSAVGF